VQQRVVYLRSAGILYPGVYNNRSVDYDGITRVGRRRRRRQKRNSGSLGAFLGIVAAAAGLACIAFFASFAYTYARVAENLPQVGEYNVGPLAQTSIVYDADGNVVDELHGGQNRFVVPMEEISPYLRDAVVAIEDHRFYEHRGLDFEAIARAARENITSMSIREGGSTITQQLIKNTFIDPEYRSIPSFQRKITEASLAWQYEKTHTKEEILEQYLNTVFFGANAYGAEAAARTYFDKSASELTLREAALLAGIINLPGAYDPFTDPESAKKRRDVVLDRMLEYGYITREEHDRAVSSGLGLNRGRLEQQDNDNEYFLNAVQRELAAEFGNEMVYEGGLHIYTTLDSELQQMASEAVSSVVNPEAGDPSAALVSIESETGAVRAMVGGSDFEEVKFNLATQGQRQAGSAFKPFVLAEAIDQGISPETMYVSRDLSIDIRGQAEPYEVSNYGNVQRGPIDLEEAMAQSDNTVFVQLAQDLGMRNVVEMAHRLGIESELDPYLSTALGGLRVGVTPLEMASAYSTFANRGEHMKPFLVTKVTRIGEDGREEVLLEHEPEGERVLSEDEAATVTEVLRAVVERGTASRFHNLDAALGRPAAGKTGTTDRFVDAWFVGYVPQLTTSVWVGYPQSSRPMINVRGYQQINGENFPLDIWAAYMSRAVQKYPYAEFEEPSDTLNLEVKRDGRAYSRPERSGRGDVASGGRRQASASPGGGQQQASSSPGGGDVVYYYRPPQQSPPPIYYHPGTGQQFQQPQPGVRYRIIRP
jgi:penicillin-binding protein 1A